MSAIDLAVQQLQEHDHDVGYISDTLRQLIIEGLSRSPGDNEVTAKRELSLQLEKEFEAADIFVNDIKILKKPGSAVVLLTTSGVYEVWF